MPAGTGEGGADQREILVVCVRGPGRPWRRLLGPPGEWGGGPEGRGGESGGKWRGWDKWGGAAGPPMPKWSLTRARHAGWRLPKRVSSALSGWAWASVASIMA